MDKKGNECFDLFAFIIYVSCTYGPINDYEWERDCCTKCKPIVEFITFDLVFIRKCNGKSFTVAGYIRARIFFKLIKNSKVIIPINGEIPRTIAISNDDRCSHHLIECMSNIELNSTMDQRSLKRIRMI